MDFKTIEEVKTLIDNYDILKDKAADMLVDAWNHQSVDDVSYYFDKNTNTDMLEISYTEYCRGESYFEREDLPMAWLFLDEYALIQAKIKFKQDRERERKEYEEKRKLEKAKEEERKEREQYEKLKAKYEKETI